MSAASSTEQRPLRAVVAGVGVGRRYGESFRALPDLDLAAVCASSQRSARAAADELGGVAAYEDFDLMLAEQRPDIVAIATPNDLHREMTLRAIAAGAHVLCDKPLALNASEAQEMADAAAAAGVRTIVPFWWRFLPAMSGARRLLQEGSLGELFFVDVRYLNRGWGAVDGPMRWQFQGARAGSGALGNVGSHTIDLVQWLAGPIVCASAQTAINVPVRRWPDGTPARPDVEDTVAMVGRFHGGQPLCLLASSVAHVARSRIDVCVHLSGGSVSVSAQTSPDGGFSSSLMSMRAGDSAPRQEPIVDLRLAGGAGLRDPDAAYVAIAAELVAAIREQRPAVPGLADGASAQRVIDAALASAVSGRMEQVAAPLAGG